MDERDPQRTMTTEITVRRKNQSTFQVEVKEGTSKTVHAVKADPTDIEKYGGRVSAEHLIKKSFAFLLEREPKESILSTFELSVIEQYFPEYPKEIRQRIEE